MTSKKQIKKISRPRVTSLDSRIFADLHKAKRPLPVQRLAKRLDVSWKTANEHVKKLKRLGVLNTKKSIRKTSVSINPSLLRLLKQPTKKSTARKRR